MVKWLHLWVLSNSVLGPLFYRYLENDKVTSLKLNKESFDAPPNITSEEKQDLKIIGNIEKPIVLAQKMILNIFVTRLHIFGMQILIHKIYGAWNMEGKAFHINCMELCVLLCITTLEVLKLIKKINMSKYFEIDR